MSEDYINEPWTEAHVQRYMRDACFSDPVQLCIFLKAGQQDWKDKTRAYEAAIRKHRDQRGDDRCWMDDEELYKALPEGYTPPARDTAVELRNWIEELRSQLANIHEGNIKGVLEQLEIVKSERTALRAKLEKAKALITASLAHSNPQLQFDSLIEALEELEKA